jgi:hypothetical protein
VRKTAGKPVVPLRFQARKQTKMIAAQVKKRMEVA